MRYKLLRVWNAIKSYVKVAALELGILLAVVVADLVSKKIVDVTMNVGDSVTIIPWFLHFTYFHNTNAAFGSAFGLDKILSAGGVRVALVVLSLVAIVFFSIFMYRNRSKNKISRIAYALIIGGAIGNLYDRLFLGFVRDFVQIEYFGLKIFGSTTFAIFNIADAALTIGVILFIIYYVFIWKSPDSADEKSVEVNSDSDSEESDSVSDEKEENVSACDCLDVVTTDEKSDSGIHLDGSDGKNQD